MEIFVVLKKFLCKLVKNNYNGGRDNEIIIKKIKTLEEDFKMAYKITDACVNCGACESECPVNAISAGDGLYVVDAATCIDCGACASVCPVDAPQPE
ncbi:4Fe-4S dicluster domain-containing protein [Peptoclostridium litorale DSM 5388]|uniref:Ferredoxin n=2 Tax=Peptoclostridium litorale TaxID=1557 RepID=A0A069RJ72_PEPLI|nr:hypothetical protein CLIT_4c00120 [Peptoclostridium litorale DSM 5388]SIO12963.1 4Fe-4S dicluster domain-containing protein [Peptoclostridium litorale DSM 5388]